MEKLVSPVANLQLDTKWREARGWRTKWIHGEQTEFGSRRSTWQIRAKAFGSNKVIQSAEEEQM